MDDPLNLAFLKERYNFELQRKEQLTASLALPVGVLGGMGSALALMISFVCVARNSALTIFFSSVIVTDIIAFILCMWYLSLAFHRQKYIYLPKLVELETFRTEWREFYEYAKAKGADDDFVVHELRKRIIEAADQNTDKNDERAASLSWLTLFSVASGSSGSQRWRPFHTSQMR